MLGSSSVYQITGREPIAGNRRLATTTRKTYWPHTISSSAQSRRTPGGIGSEAPPPPRSHSPETTIATAQVVATRARMVRLKAREMLMELGRSDVGRLAIGGWVARRRPGRVR